MARPIKKTVDYFPHRVNHGKTLYVLETKWGNDGYAFWFKLLEILGSTEGMVIDCDNLPQWEFLLAKTRVDEDTAFKILDTLAGLGAIHQQLWTQKVVFCQKFIEGVSDAFKRRTDCIPQLSGVSAYINSEKVDKVCALIGKGKERKGKESNIGENTKTHPRLQIPPALDLVRDYCRERKNGIDPQAFIDHYDSRGWKYGNTKIVDWQAAVRTWERNKKKDELKSSEVEHACHRPAPDPMAPR